MTDAQEKPAFNLLTADAILSTHWPEPVWAIPGLLQEGLTILAGAPKLGKLWQALQIAHGVAIGGQVLGQSVQEGPVLYLALEDPPRRLKSRMEKQGWSSGLDVDFLPIRSFYSPIDAIAKSTIPTLRRACPERRVWNLRKAPTHLTCVYRHSFYNACRL